MYATDHILQAPMWALEQEAEKAREEAERWALHAEHMPDCQKTDVFISVVGNATFTEPCCPYCYQHVWKYEEGMLLHQLNTDTRRQAA